MNTKICILLLLLFNAFDAKAQSFQLRQEVLKEIAKKDYRPTFSVLAARLKTGIYQDQALRQLDTLLSREYGDMFWMYGCAGLYFSCKDILPDNYKAKIRECWKKYTPYRGDTENHFLMYYSSLYLLSEEWPDLPDSDWFMGKSSKEIHDESASYLNFFINRTVRFGQIEFDSPRYMYYYITPLLLLNEYAQDTVVKRRCGMMVEFLLADYAAKYLNGSLCGSNSRVSNEAALNPRSAEMTSYGEYFFNDSVTHIFPDVAFAAMASFSIPEIIKTIANNRAEPYVIEEIKRSREMIRYSSELNKAVNMYSFMTKDFALGSFRGGLVQPIQQRSWSLVLNSDHQNNIIFGLHPFVSKKELGMFFPEEPSFILEKIDAVKHGYSSEDKWVGGSPYETIRQYKNQIECRYSIPKKERYSHVDIFIPGWGKFLPGDKIHGHDIRIQYDSCIVTIVARTPYELKREGENFRLRLSLVARKTSYYLSCSRLDEFNEFDDRTAMPAEKTYSVDKQNGEWLFRSKFLESKLGSAILKMKYGTNERILDFTTNTIR